MPAKRAVKAHREEKHNCAQSVLRGFQAYADIAEQTIVDAQSLGGGRAPNGQCGALHAALTLISSPDAQRKLVEAFVDQAGAESCREVRKLGRLSCTDCVRVAAELVGDLRDAEPTK